MSITIGVCARIGPWPSSCGSTAWSPRRADRVRGQVAVGHDPRVDDRAQVLGREACARRARASRCGCGTRAGLRCPPRAPPRRRAATASIARTSCGCFVSRSGQNGSGPRSSRIPRSSSSIARPSGKLRGTSTRRRPSCRAGRARSRRRPAALLAVLLERRRDLRPGEHAVDASPAAARGPSRGRSSPGCACAPSARTGTGRGRRSRSGRGCRRRSRRRRRADGRRAPLHAPSVAVADGVGRAPRLTAEERPSEGRGRAEGRAAGGAARGSARSRRPSAQGAGWNTSFQKSYHSRLSACAGTRTAKTSGSRRRSRRRRNCTSVTTVAATKTPTTSGVPDPRAAGATAGRVPRPFAAHLTPAAPRPGRRRTWRRRPCR